MLADAAAELDDVAAGLTACEAKGGQFQEIAEHGKEVPGIDSIASRLWGRLFFHLESGGSIFLVKRVVRIFSYLTSLRGGEQQRKGRRLVESKCRCRR
jgi:hypothetical protein